MRIEAESMSDFDSWSKLEKVKVNDNLHKVIFIPNQDMNFAGKSVVQLSTSDEAFSKYKNLEKW